MNTIRQLRKQKGITQTELGDVLGVSKNAISYYETGQRGLSIELLLKLADYFGVTVDEVLGRDDEEDQEPEPDQTPQLNSDNASFSNSREENKPVKTLQSEYEIEYEEEIEIPIVASLQCGYNTAGEPNVIIGRYKVPKSYIKKYGKEIVLNYASGRSMVPTINPGDLMLCYPGDLWDDGTIVIVNVDDMDTIKRIYRNYEDGGVDLVPDNPEVPTKHYSPKEMEESRFSVIGHVILVMPQELGPVPRRKD